MPKSNSFFAQGDSKAKLIYKYVDSNTNETYHFIAGNKLYLVKEDVNKNTSLSEYEFSNVVKENSYGSDLIFSNEQYILKFNESKSFEVIGVKEGYFFNHVNKNLIDALNPLRVKQNRIMVHLNQNYFAEYDMIKKQFYLYHNDKIPLGECSKNSSRYYFYDTVMKKYYYGSLNYIDPKNYYIQNLNGRIQFDYRGNSALNESNQNENLFIKNIEKNKKFAILMEHLTSGSKNSKVESCKNLYQDQFDLKKTLCSITQELNSGNLLSAYTNINSKTLVFTLDQASFRQIHSVNETFENKNSPIEYWGVGDWIANSAPFHNHQKSFAFGEIPNQFENNNKYSYFFNDIRFVDERGNVLRAFRGSKNMDVKDYMIDYTFPENERTQLVGGFVLSNLHFKYLYIIKSNGTYDQLSPYNYSKMTSGYLNDLIPKIYLNADEQIKNVIKLKEKVVFYKFSKNLNKYTGYYIVPISYITNKTNFDQVSYVEI